MRNDILNRKNEIIHLIESNTPKSVICKTLNCKPETLDAYLNKFNIIYKGNIGRKGFLRIHINEYLENRLPIKSNELKLKLYKEGLKKQECEECGITKWNNGDITFELHHIDGDGYNNNLINLKILCPNCHSQTKDFRKKKIK